MPLQRIREAVAGVRKLDQNEHLSEYCLVALGQNVGWQPSTGKAAAGRGFDALLTNDSKQR